MNGFGKDTFAHDHREVAELLPWYVNGTLRGRELERLTQHLERCDFCRDELAQQQRLADLIRSSEDLASSPERDLERLTERLDREAESESSKREESSGGLVGRFRDGFHGLAAPVRWALAAQLVVIVALGAALLRGHKETGGEFETKAAPSAAMAGGEAAWIRVVFDATASEGEIRSLLIESGSQIVAGPSPFGVYTIESSSGSDQQALDSLRSSDLVVFAEPVGGTQDINR